MELGQVVGKLQSDVERHQALRLPLYMSESRIGDVFQLWQAPVREVLTSSGVEAELSASVLRLVSVGGSKSASESAVIELTPMLRVRLLEEALRERGLLFDLATAEPYEEPGLVTFVGNGRLILPWEGPVTAHTDMGLSAEAAAALQEERERWETIQKNKHGDDQTIVWLGSGHAPLASIFGPKSVNWQWVDSHPQPPHGILGVYGQTLNGVVLITALFLWHEQRGAMPSS